MSAPAVPFGYSRKKSLKKNVTLSQITHLKINYSAISLATESVPLYSKWPGNSKDASQSFLVNVERRSHCAPICRVSFLADCVNISFRWKGTMLKIQFFTHNFPWDLECIQIKPVPVLPQCHINISEDCLMPTERWALGLFLFKNKYSVPCRHQNM